MVAKWIESKCFEAIHTKNLVYNTCWEDPRLDRRAMQLSHDDRVVMITSAGCNALDYALDRPASICSVDINPLQNALLELKIAAIRTVSFDDFFSVFGSGRHPDWKRLYRSSIRPELGENARAVWDRRLDFFDGSSRRGSFYFRGSSGLFAWLINQYLNRSGLRGAVQRLLQAGDLATQQQIFRDEQVHERLWRYPVRWLLRRDTTMAMLGVPKPQRLQIERTHRGGIEGFIRDRVETVLTKFDLSDNYFWRVYLTGSYDHSCCPEYLRRENFHQLRDDGVDRITWHTDRLQCFLERGTQEFSRFILLDHMDWLAERYPHALASEWQSIMDSATPRARILWRSAGPSVDFVDPIQILRNGSRVSVGQILNYQTGLASELHDLDRVNTYGSFYIADCHNGDCHIAA